MRRVPAVLVAILLGGSGCARSLPLTDYDRCGLQGMELEGVQISESVHRLGRSRARGVLCRLPPRDNRDRICEVQAYEAKAIFKMNNKRRSNAALAEVADASVAEWQRVYRNCMTGAG